MKRKQIPTLLFLMMLLSIHIITKACTDKSYTGEPEMYQPGMSVASFAFDDPVTGENYNSRIRQDTKFILVFDADCGECQAAVHTIADEYNASADAYPLISLLLFNAGNTENAISFKKNYDISPFLLNAQPKQNLLSWLSGGRTPVLCVIDGENAFSERVTAPGLKAENIRKLLMKYR